MSRSEDKPVECTFSAILEDGISGHDGEFGPTLFELGLTA